MKRLLVVLALSLGCFLANAQIDKSLLRKAIGYYQQLDFEKSIELFDQLVTENPNDISLQGRRGFVISEYIKAIDDKKVSSIDLAAYNELVKKGVDDLKLSIEDFPTNADNKKALEYLNRKL